MSKIIEDSYAAPIVTILTTDGELIKDDQGNRVGRHCVDFEYIYDEEGEDKCTIVFQSSNIQLSALPLFRINKRIRVQWGYTEQGGKSILSPTRLVLIRDLQADYTEKEIKLTLKCTDVASQGYHSANNSTGGDQNFLEFLSEIGAGVFKPAVTVYDDVNVSESIKTDEMVEEQKAREAPLSYAPAVNTRVDFFSKIDFFFRQKRTTPMRSMAILRAIKNEMKSAPGGPYLMDTRDDKLNIHNRNYNQKPFRNYRYAGEGGDVISVTIRTENKAKPTSGSKSAMNPESKELGSEQLHVINYSELDNMMNLFGVSEDAEQNRRVNEYTQNEVKQYYETLKANPSLEIKPPPLKVGEAIYSTMNNYDGALHTANKSGIRSPENADFQDPLGLYKQRQHIAVESTSVPLRFDLKLDLEIPPGVVYNGVDNGDEGLKNRIKETIQKLVQGTMVIIGDPAMESSVIITLENLASNHIGNFYVKKVTHKLTRADGYKTTMDIMKKPVTISTTTWGGTTKKKSFRDMVLDKGKLTAEGERQLFDEIVKAGGLGIATQGGEAGLFEAAEKLGIPIKDKWRAVQPDQEAAVQQTLRDIETKEAGDDIPKVDKQTKVKKNTDTKTLLDDELKVTSSKESSQFLKDGIKNIEKINAKFR